MSKSGSYVRKITVGGVYGVIQAPPEGVVKPLIQVGGVVSNAETESSKLDPTKSYYRFLGNFRAVHCESGEVYDSANLIVPEPLQSVLASAVKQAGEVPMIEFVGTIGVKHNAKSPTKYEFVYTPAIAEKAAEDAKAKLFASLPEVQPTQPKLIQESPALKSKK